MTTPGLPGNAGKQLRSGFTTGTCAALAAGAATRMLLGQAVVKKTDIVTPKGTRVQVDVLDPDLSPDAAACSVQKDAGDDPDVTNRMFVRVVVSKTDGCEIEIDGGDGVGRVTRPGLDQPPGAAAINSVPRRMIREEVDRARREFSYNGGLAVVVSVPDGEKIAASTFNPHLGIVGGVSIIGTTGIVEPMSSAALVDSIGVELRVLRAEGTRDAVFTPGNLGAGFVRKMPELSAKPQVKVSNFIGDALDIAARLGFENVVVAGHVGKLIKLAGGVMNTHSRIADCRLELLALFAHVAGAGAKTTARILAAKTVEEGIGLLDDSPMSNIMRDVRSGFDPDIRARVMRGILERANIYLNRRAGGAFRVGVVMFWGGDGEPGISSGAEEILETWREK